MPNIVTEVNEGPLSEALLLLPEKMGTIQARVMVLACCYQESKLIHRRQFGNGPARGLAQFEQGNARSRGGVWGVVHNRATTFQAMKVAAARKISGAPALIWAAMETDDVLSLAFARLLLWADPRPLPEVGDVDAAWETYLRCWNPGKPREDDWPESYDIVLTGLGLAE